MTPRDVAAAALLLFSVATAQATESAIPQAAHDQVEAERHAIRLVARPDIQAALKPLEERWQQGSPGLLPETLAQIHASIEEVIFMVALETIDGDPRRPQVVEISASPHRWFETDVRGGRWGINNPDTLYFTVPVEPGSRYIVTGRRRNPGPTDSNFTLQTPDVWGAVGNIGQRDLKVDPDGTYKIVVDDSPAEGRPNHLQIKGGASALLIRNTLADWSRELPDLFTVERVAGPPAGPQLSDDVLAQTVIARMERVITHSVADLQPPIFRLPPNTIPQPGKIADKPGFLVTQRNTLGHFRLADDEAIVATFDPGDAGYATFPVTNVWGISPDPRRHQNSLNGRQALRNPDGTITVVLANWDPGVANWIDPAGLREGIIMLRWQLLGQEASGATVKAKLVKRDALKTALPRDIALVTPKKRAALLAKRAADFERRFGDRF